MRAVPGRSMFASLGPVVHERDDPPITAQVRRPVPSVRHLDLPGPVLRWVRKTQTGYMALVGHTGGQMICGFKFNYLLLILVGPRDDEKGFTRSQ